MTRNVENEQKKEECEGKIILIFKIGKIKEILGLFLLSKRGHFPSWGPVDQMVQCLCGAVFVHPEVNHCCL